MEKKIINLKKDGKTKWKLGNSYFQIFYSGEIKENKPDGFGISEEYVFPTYNDDVYMKNSEYKIAWKNYSKNFIYKDNLSYSLIQRYEGHWKNGKRNGKGKLITFFEVHIEDFMQGIKRNNDGSPKIYEKKIGTFVDDKEQGIFEVFNGSNWEKFEYKNGQRGERVK